MANTVRLHIMVSPELKKDLETAAAYLRMSEGALVRDLLEGSALDAVVRKALTGSALPTVTTITRELATEVAEDPIAADYHRRMQESREELAAQRA